LWHISLSADAPSRINVARKIECAVRHARSEHCRRAARRSDHSPCRGFAKLWDCNGLAVANLYALCSADPATLWSHPDPVGPDNDDYLWNFARECGDVICAWGSNARPEHAARVASIMLDAGARLWCLDTTKDGSPRHPLYMRNDQPLIAWSPAAVAASAENGDTA
jgi:hypothetical protein